MFFLVSGIYPCLSVFVYLNELVYINTVAFNILKEGLIILLIEVCG